MPLYEYECTSCHRRTEKIQKFSDPELTVCPHCGGPLQRTVTAAAVSFKGGGWYKDLYSSARPAAAAGDSSGSGESKSDAGATAGKAESVSASADAGSSAKPAESAKPAPAAAAPATPSSTKS